MNRSLAILLIFLILLPLSHAMAEDASKAAESPIRLGGSGDDSITHSGFLLADIDRRDSSGFMYQWMGFDGTEHEPWQVTFKDTAVNGLELFRWNGEIWQEYAIQQDGGTDVMLKRLVIPEQVK